MEIRLQIWQYTVGNQTIHIINKYRRLGHTVMDDEYWRQYHAERPSLRACSWIYSYGSLPTTKQLADNNMCDLLATCRKIYQEAASILYMSNTFVFWDLRNVAIFERCIPVGSWQKIRSVEVYAMFYRKEDIDHAVEARSLLQFEVWPGTCAALAALPNLRSLKIFLANPSYLDKQYLTGRRWDVQKAVLNFARQCRVKLKAEVYLPNEKWRGDGAAERWGLKELNAKDVKRMREQLKEDGINCELLCCSHQGTSRSVITS